MGSSNASTIEPSDGLPEAELLLHKVHSIVEQHEAIANEPSLSARSPKLSWWPPTRMSILIEPCWRGSLLMD